MQRVLIAAALGMLLLLAGCDRGAGTQGESATPTRTILVTGATGTQGGAVARELLGRGFAVRALTRNPDQPAARALADLGAEVVQGDFGDPASLAAAMSGTHGVFAVTDFWEHGYDVEVEHGAALIAAAEDADVAHFLFSSVAGADGDTGLAHFESKFEIEGMLGASGLDYTILRPVEFMDNWRYSRDALLAGRYVNPRNPQDRHQWIAASDIGFFAGEAFDNPADWLGRVEEIAGDELTLEELRGAMEKAFGRPVEYVQVSWESFEEAAGEEMAAMYRWFTEDGYDVDVEALRTRYPDLKTVREYLAEFAAGGPGDRATDREEP